jgi:hypothetical protein
LNSLFKAKIDWGIYLIVAILIRISFFDMSWLCYIAILITLHQFFLFFYALGYMIPVRFLAGAFMCMQMLLGPAMAYSGLDAYQRPESQMQIPQFDYFMYAIPAVLFFIMGLHVSAGKLKGEFINQDKIRKYVQENETLPYYFVAFGFVASFIGPYFGSELGFVFFLFANFKFIGAFLLILGNKTPKPLYLVLVFGSIVASSLQQAMFHDLITWLIFLGAVLALKYKPSVNIKALFAIGFAMLALVIQQLKGDYRAATWSGQEGAGLSTFVQTYDQSESKGRFSMESIAKSNIRINQGYIVTHIMKTVPYKVPYEDGDEMLEILKAAILPRILAPNKLMAGDRTIFMKYTGLFLMPGTSMGLSTMGDAYVNFGTFGGTIFMFFFGLLFSEILNAFYKRSFEYPVLLLFLPMVFYYPIRPDCELQTILGHLFKSCFLIFVMLHVWKAKLKLNEQPGKPVALTAKAT